MIAYVLLIHARIGLQVLFLILHEGEMSCVCARAQPKGEIKIGDDGRVKFKGKRGSRGEGQKKFLDTKRIGGLSIKMRVLTVRTLARVKNGRQ